MRKQYLDNIRWFTVILVVTYHVIFMYNGVEIAGTAGPFHDNQYQDAYLYVVYPWFMILLFAVSGMCARFSLNHQTHREFIRSRSVKQLVPSTIGLLVFWWSLGYFNLHLSGAYTEIRNSVPAPVCFLIMAVSGTGPLWYIQLLWFFSVVLVFIRKLEKERFYRLCGCVNVPILLLLSIAVYGAAQVLNTPIVLVYRFGFYGIGFFIGYFCLSHDAVMERLEKVWLPLTVAAVILCGMFLYRYWGMPYGEHVVMDTFLCNLFAWIGVLAVLSFMKRWGDRSSGIAEWMKKKAWGLYVMHYLPLAACVWYMSQYGQGIPVFLKYILAAAAAFGGAIIFCEIICRIPVLRWCVLGIGKEKYHVS